MGGRGLNRIGSFAPPERIGLMEIGGTDCTDRPNRLYRLHCANLVSSSPKPIRFSAHALEQCAERGATTEEVEKAIREGTREPAKRGRTMYRYTLQFNGTWHGRKYAMKQVAAVVAEKPAELVVVTVYTFYF